MPVLTPREAADLILTGEGYFFLLRGNAPGKGFWTGAVTEFVAVANEDLSVAQFGSYLHGLEAAGNIYNAITCQHPDSIIAISPYARQAEERKARGLAMMLNRRFIPVDNFLTEEDRRWIPERVPVKAAASPNPEAIIVDLDGTLADSSHRSPFFSTFDEIMNDKVIRHVAEMVKMSYYCYGRNILFVSGRGGREGEREATEAWLAAKIEIDTNGSSVSRLFTRKVGDGRDDTIVKLEIFNNHIRDKYDVKLVLDDRPLVCRLWSDLGLPVLCNIDLVKGEF